MDTSEESPTKWHDIVMDRLATLDPTQDVGFMDDGTLPKSGIIRCFTYAIDKDISISQIDDRTIVEMLNADNPYPRYPVGHFKRGPLGEMTASEANSRKRPKTTHEQQTEKAIKEMGNLLKQQTVVMKAMKAMIPKHLMPQKPPRPPKSNTHKRKSASSNPNQEFEPSETLPEAQIHRPCIPCNMDGVEDCPPSPIICARCTREGVECERLVIEDEEVDPLSISQLSGTTAASALVAPILSITHLPIASTDEDYSIVEPAFTLIINPNAMAPAATRPPSDVTANLSYPPLNLQRNKLCDNDPDFVIPTFEDVLGQHQAACVQSYLASRDMAYKETAYNVLEIDCVFRPKTGKKKQKRVASINFPIGWDESEERTPLLSDKYGEFDDAQRANQTFRHPSIHAQRVIIEPYDHRPGKLIKIYGDHKDHFPLFESIFACCRRKQISAGHMEMECCFLPRVQLCAYVKEEQCALSEATIYCCYKVFQRTFRRLPNKYKMSFEYSCCVCGHDFEVPRETERVSINFKGNNTICEECVDDGARDAVEHHELISKEDEKGDFTPPGFLTSPNWLIQHPVWYIFAQASAINDFRYIREVSLEPDLREICFLGDDYNPQLMKMEENPVPDWTLVPLEYWRATYANTLLPPMIAGNRWVVIFVIIRFSQNWLIVMDRCGLLWIIRVYRQAASHIQQAINAFGLQDVTHVRAVGIINGPPDACEAFQPARRPKADQNTIPMCWPIFNHLENVLSNTPRGGTCVILAYGLDGIPLPKSTLQGFDAYWKALREIRIQVVFIVDNKQSRIFDLKELYLPQPQGSEAEQVQLLRYMMRINRNTLRDGAYFSSTRGRNMFS